MKCFRSFCVVVVSILISVQAFAQNGIISGKIIDASSGETLPGAVVMVVGSNQGAAADMDGIFRLTNVNAGKCDVIVKCLSYKSKQITGVEVVADKTATLNISLESAENNLSEVVIVTEAKRESVTSLLIQQKNNVSVSDGISSESIKKTADKSSSDILKRISGASIQENRFAIIRGMNDRYNAAFLNGLPLPSTESDRKAFSFDIFPSSIIENMVITKTGNPEMVGDFAGGVIGINTKETPDSKLATVAISTGFNTLTTEQNFKTYHGGKTDFIGIDDGIRQLPKGMPASMDFRSINSSDPRRAEITKQFNGNWGINSSSVTPNMGLQLGLGNTYKVLGKDFGAIFALTYSASNKFTETDRYGYGLFNQQNFEFTDQQYSRNTLAGLLANFTYKLSNNSKISFKNLYSINSDNQTTERTGKSGLSDENPNLTKAYIYSYNQNRLVVNQLEGTHLLGKEASKGYKLTWNIGYSDIHRILPDYRSLSYSRADETQPYMASIPNFTPSPTNSGRFYSDLKEKQYSGRYDFTLPLNFSSNAKNDLKIGGFHQLRERSFEGRKFGYISNARGSRADSLNKLGPEHIFSTENIGKNGFVLEEITGASDKYSASSHLHAGFVMFDTRLFSSFRFVYGVRVEHFTQKLNSKDESAADISFKSEKLDLLPSLNFTYSLTEKANLRFAYYKSLNRPEYRELAPFGFYDFNVLATILGNNELKRASIDNFDVRYEYYGQGNQFFSISAFYKELLNPIELSFLATTGGDTRTFTYYNTKSATNKGIELEFRKTLSFLGSGVWENITVFSNLALIKSEVKYLEGATSTTGSKRALQGQSPYLFNAGLQYENKERGFSVSGLVNQVGPRIVYAGNQDAPDIYEKQRTVVDATLSKTFGPLEVKLTISDILHQNLVFYEDRNHNAKLENTEGVKSLSKDRDNVLFNFRNGTTYGLRIAYKF